MKITKKEISEAAIQMFLEKGYSNVTIQNICDQLNITKPTFYNYINAKEDLILDLYDVTITALVNNTYDLLSANSHYEQLLVIFSTLIHDTQKYGADLFSQMFIANFKENHHSFDMRQELTRLCLLIIRKAQENQEIMNTCDPEILYEALAHTYIGYEAQWCIYKGDQRFEESFYQAMNAILMVHPDHQNYYLRYLSKND